MIDPRREAVLIRERDADRWHDKTSDIAEYHHLGGRIAIDFGRGRGPLPYGEQRVEVMTQPTRVAVPDSKVIVDGDLWRSQVHEILEFRGDRGAWRRVFYRANGADERYTTRRAEEVRVAHDPAQSPRVSAVLDYWRSVVAELDPKDNALPEAYKSLQHIHPDSALARYLQGELPAPRRANDPMVIPFGINLSQRDALARALAHPISVIQGPPGTGKTETILNFITSILAEDLGTVGVVSFSNAAVDNVRDKLDDEGFGHLVANLGRTRKREEFFAAQETRNAAVKALLDGPVPTLPPREQLARAGAAVRDLQAAERRRAELRSQIDAFELEQRHFEQHLQRHEVPELNRLPLMRRSSARILQFLAKKQLQDAGWRPGLATRVRDYFTFGSLRGVTTQDSDVVLRLQARFYEQRIAELHVEFERLDKQLRRADLVGLVARHRTMSRDAFTALTAARLAESPGMRYSEEDYRKGKFKQFCRDYPVVLSTCHSLRRNLPNGHLLDYLVIDEASQVDLLTAALALASCRNVLVVGDVHQLPQISAEVPAGVEAPAPAYDYLNHSILSSLTELYGESLPTTLLREHYRCHPTIIGFCNATFYDGQLVPYTTASDREPGPAMVVRPTTEGNHMRWHRDGGGLTNQREIDVISEEVLPEALSRIPAEDIAIATPYRRQVARATSQLDEELAIDTVHKLQGRQKKMVILMTVLSETWRGQLGLRFVDDPRLVNVAVSRAIDHFVVVTNHDKLPKSRYLRDLVGYIDYHNPDEPTVQSGVVSVFDLLYREYAEQLWPLAQRLRPEAAFRSEEVMRVFLGDILAEPEHTHLRAEAQIRLRSLVPDLGPFDERQQAFIRHGATSVDFVVYNKITNGPLLAVEVDGFRFHEDNPEQRQRDAIKDLILNRVGMPLLRLPTTGSGEGQQLRRAIARAQEHPNG